MARKPAAIARTSPTLPFYKVLEDEYRVFHGELPDEYVKAKRDKMREPISADKINRELVALMYEWIHKLPREERRWRSALCLSGGGIRSGTFALGVMQGLARRGLLDKFDYLSTVSGGGYIGSWLTAWIHRHTEGVRGVARELASTAQPSDPLAPEPEPVRFLRSYSNFLTPRVGLLTADTWTFLTIITRNLLINWTVMIPLLLAVIAVPRVFVALIHEQAPLWVMNLTLIVGLLMAIIGLAYIHLSRPTVSDAVIANAGDDDSCPRSFWECVKAARSEGASVLRCMKGQGSFLVLCWTPLILSGLALTTYWAWFCGLDFDPGALSIRLVLVREFFGSPVQFSLIESFVLIGALCNLVSWLIYVLWMRRFTIMGAILAFAAGAVGGLSLWALATLISPFYYRSPPASDEAATGFAAYIANLAAWNEEIYVCLAMPFFLMVITLGLTFVMALTSRRERVRDEDREWWSRASAWLTLAALGWAASTSLVIFGPSVLIEVFRYLAPLGILSGLLTVLLGRSAQTPANAEEAATPRDWKSRLSQHALQIAAPVFLIFFLIVLAFVTNWLVLATGNLASWAISASREFIAPPTDPFGIGGLWQRLTKQTVALTTGINWSDIFDDSTTHLQVIHYTPSWLIVLLIAALLLFGLFVARCVLNLNRFSLHGAYRNRLVRAFLGASRRGADRRPNPFTGFDPADNIYMHELRPGMLSVDHLSEGLDEFVEQLKRGEQYDERDDERQDEKKSRGRKFFAYLHDNLSPEVREQLDEHEIGDAPSPGLAVELIEDLNRMLESAELYERYRRDESDDDDSPSSPQGNSLILQNRLILEEHFPQIKRYDQPPPPHKLLHVVNLTLNLVGGKNLAWQQRKAESFTVSPLHAGNHHLGYRESSAFGGRENGISLGTAATISGAAANPNMGYFSSSPVVTFFMTLFNVRLGWWLGNTGRAGDDTYRWSFPKLAIQPLLAEAFGMTNNTSAYINLSDGGHFENLALYEMILRRCHFIVVVDGAQDEGGRFGDLGNALRKIRIDLGIPITFNSVEIYPRGEKRKGKYCALATIDYSRVDGNNARQGTLIYIKPAFYRDEPTDVLNYGLHNREFPHETTADQFFDESQFESYRMLGLHIIEEIFKDENGAPYPPPPDIEQGLTVEEFQAQVKTYLKRGTDTIQRDGNT